jgi:glutaconate CoA-transferase subunit A
MVAVLPETVSKINLRDPGHGGLSPQPGEQMPNLTSSKIVNLAEAVDRYITDGCSLAMGTALETLIPFAAGHEVIRQAKRDITLIGPISDILFDQLIGAGCVRKVCAAWVGNVITGSGYNFRRGVESGALLVEDHSNFTMAAALKAGAMGVPYLPVKTALGSDLFQTNPRLKRVNCPFTGVRLVAVNAICPDVTVVHAQRSDPQGNAHVWGNLGVARDACLASRHVVLTVEEIVSPQIIQSDPNRVLIPGFRVDAVVHCPWGAYPSPVAGYYNRDHQVFIDYQHNSRDERRFAQWRERWIDTAASPDDRLNLIGQKRREALSITHHLKSEPADYGY